MPSIQDVANDINAKLDLIATNTAATAAATVQLDNHLEAGVVTLAGGLFAIWETQKETNAILDFHSQQHATMICLLEAADTLLCGISRKLTTQLELSERQAVVLERLGSIFELVHAREATESDRLSEVRAELARCCPPPEKKPEPCPPPCREPREKRYEPNGQDWRPPEPQRIG
ncbi:MAG: hypothetical protein ACREL3_02975 [Gemmatimonadales bacterium]